MSRKLDDIKKALFEAVDHEKKQISKSYNYKKIDSRKKITLVRLKN